MLGERLAIIARHAYLAKKMDAVEQASQLMLALPIADQLEGIAKYYQALCTWRRGDISNARRSLEGVAEGSTPQYRARALQIIGLTHHDRCELDAALGFYIAAGKASLNCDFLTHVESHRMMAVIRSCHGDHSQALEHLEKLFPSVRAAAKVFPVLYYDYLNSLAVELGEVGRLEEANAALSVSLASPFALAYPEWSETRDEIAAKRRAASPSVVAIHRVPEVDQTHETDRARDARRATDAARTREAHRAIEARRATRAALAAQAQSQRKANPFSALAVSSQASYKDFFQRSTIKFPARTTTALNNAASILDRVLICVGPRAPPSLS